VVVSFIGWYSSQRGKTFITSSCIKYTSPM